MGSSWGCFASDEMESANMVNHGSVTVEPIARRIVEENTYFWKRITITRLKIRIERREAEMRRVVPDT